ncbi:MAG: VOC family protein [Planctomycetota bacterium]
MRIQGGNATVYVSDLDRAIDFYTVTLGLELRLKASDHWAEVGAADSLLIGLHKVAPESAGPGGSSIRIGLHVEGKLEEAMTELSAQGIGFGDVVEDGGPVRLAYFNDPDGNPLYLWEFVAIHTPP